jgi:predicted permease
VLTVLTITLPVFAVMGLGYVSVWRGLFAPAEMRTFGKFVLNIALPALLFVTLATRDLAEIVNPAYLAAYALAGLATGAVALAVLGAQGEGAARRAVGWIGVNSPNSAFIGFPLLTFLAPDIAGPVLAMNFLVENFLLVPIGLILLDQAKATGAGILALLWRTIWGVLQRPLMIALMAGLGFAMTGLELPATLQRLFGFVGASASALALFAVGGGLFGSPARGNTALAAQITLGKLLIHPALALAVQLLIPLPPVLATALVLSCALPMFTIYGVLVQGSGEQGVAALSMLWANLAAVVTVTAARWGLQAAA